MQTYAAPIRDMRFVVHELHDYASHLRDLGFDEATPDLLDAILEEAAKFTAGVLLPLNATGDAEGCHFDGGVVRTPSGFKAAYGAYVDAGYGSLTADSAFGGQGLPQSVGQLVEEMVTASGLAFSLYPGLTLGACRAIRSHGSVALKELYLPKMITGRWSGTMCLTESHCGTDLGLLRTQATPRADGTYSVTGSKIFISAGEHDLTENIVHLVLARLPGAPPGVRGISLLLVPKFVPNADGTLGARNGVRCARLEHKMGIKASATCQMEFDRATGWLVGEPHQGMRAMFVMMNSERISVGVQGLGIAECAYQNAVAYARERLQGRSSRGTGEPGRAADPIIVHPDVRRMLMTMRAYTEGCRALGVWVANASDRMERGPDPATRESAEDLVGLMTPVVKSLFTDLGFEAANLGLQVYGGHGYIVDQGMEQLVRDARITMIYEGTNGVQAVDLVARKLTAHGGRALQTFTRTVSEFVTAHAADPAVATLVQRLARALEALQAATSFVTERGAVDPEESGAAATDYLRLLGWVALGYMWVRMAKLATQASSSGPDAAFYQAKRITAAFFIERILPNTVALLESIRAGKASTTALDADAF